MAPSTDHALPSETETPTEATGADSPRERAVERIERKRHFHVEFVASGVAMLLLVLIWATSEYHNAGGWPAHGFSQSSGIHEVWNIWIIYPLTVWVLVMGIRAWTVYGRKPISERDIQREMEHQSRRH